ncbi:MAG: response regulator [Methylotetracoccus sp.]
MTGNLTILLVEDNPADADRTRESLRDCKLLNELNVATDGIDALAFLRREGRHIDAPRPDMILLDLNLPRKDGRELLADLKADPDLRRIPVVVLTSSKAEEDVLRSYDLQASAYITKPVGMDGFRTIIKAIDRFRCLSCAFRPDASMMPFGPPDHGMRVLLVEDDPGDRDLVEDRLAQSRTEHFEVRCAATLSDAIECLDRQRFDVILLDLGLPDSQGIETYRTVQARVPYVPVVILTGSEDEAMAREALNAGVQDYLVKDWDDATLTGRSLLYAIERKRLQQQLEQERNALEPEGDATAHDCMSHWPSNLVTAHRFGEEPLREVTPSLFNQWVDYYGQSIRMALDNRVTCSQHGVSERLRTIARRLGAQSAGPRDVIELHQTTMAKLCRSANHRQVEAYTDEGRFLLLELMGHLASFYRSRYPGTTRLPRKWTDMAASTAADDEMRRDRE